MNNIKELVNAVADKIISNKDYLTELDQAIGDGDHGINMARGMEVVKTKIAALPDDATVPDILKQIGMALVSSVGGASGPLYGTAFLRAAGAWGKENNLNAFRQALEAGVKGIQDRGKAVAGEKTMLDALIPAMDALTEAMDVGKDQKDALNAMVKAAEEGMEHTRTIIATKGRASYLGERSLGHQDPGATSSTIMLKTGVDFLNGVE